MKFIFDVETTGLPRIVDSTISKDERYKDIRGFNSARLLSISWILLHNETVIEQAYYIVKPTDFDISFDSIRIHGITKEYAMKEGISRDLLFQKLKIVLEKCSDLVAHNIRFDVSILASELFRAGEHDILKMFLEKKQICTMQKGKLMMGVTKYPKLGELYKYLYGEDITNAHNAQYDTLYCYKCFVKLFPKDKNVFHFENKEVVLTEEQESVVYEELGCNILVVACAGSGKSSTMLCRVKYLLQNDIQEESILMTTFTRDAAHDMQVKLGHILGYESKIKMGTLDAFARSVIEDTQIQTRKRSMRHVSEYAPLFLEYIKNCGPTFFKKYTYMFVDEFQDINDVQHEIIHTFYKNGVKIFAVGDASQNIYTFRGSNVQYIQNFENHFHNTKCHRLTTNFRSTKPIVKFANAVIPSTKMKPVTRSSSSCKKPCLRYFSYMAEQVTFLVKSIQGLIKKGVCEHEIAVLSPVNKSLYGIEEALCRRGIHNIILDGNSETRSHIKANHICLTTIHKSKGLEWPYVFLVDMSDAMFPRSKTPNAIEEDKRLFYVAVTRAKVELHILYYAKKSEPFITRYIQAIDTHLYDFDAYNPEYIGGTSSFDVNEYRKDSSLYDNVHSIIELRDKIDCNIEESSFITVFENNEHNAIPSGIVDGRLWEEYTDFVFFSMYRLICAKKQITPKRTYDIDRLYKGTIIKDKDVYSYTQALQSILLTEEIQNIQTTTKAMKMLMKYKDIIVSTRKQKKIVSLNDIGFFSDAHILSEYYFSFRDAIDKYQNINIPFEECLRELWTISKCRSILHQHKRSLFVTFEPSIEILSNIIAFCQKIVNNDSNIIDIIEYNKRSYILYDKILIDIRITSSFTNMYECIYTMFLITLIHSDKDIQKICVMSPHYGEYTIDLSSWSNKEQCLSSVKLDKMKTSD